MNNQLFKEQKRAEDIELGRTVEKLDYISEKLPSFAKILEEINNEYGYLPYNEVFELSLARNIVWSRVVEHCEVKGYEIKG